MGFLSKNGMCKCNVVDDHKVFVARCSKLIGGKVVSTVYNVQVRQRCIPWRNTLTAADALKQFSNKPLKFTE